MFIGPLARESMLPQILLKGGTLILHDKEYHATPSRADLLIEGDRIQAIQEVINPTDSMTVIDCKRSNQSTRFPYGQETGLNRTIGNLASSHYTPDDIFWGELSGALEAIDAGTTTVVDHAHLNYSPEHSKEALRALVASGVRSIFCYCAHQRVATWRPDFNFEKDLIPEWVMTTFRELASKNPFGPNGRVRLGFAIDTGFVSAGKLKDIFAEVRAEGVHLITSHATRIAMLDTPSAVKIMANDGLLGPDVLFSHANHTTSEELQQIKRAGAHLSSTPITEMQMGHGNPICLLPDFFEVSSLGIDCHSVCSSYLPSQMLTVLQSSRARRFDDLTAKNQWDASVGPTVEDVYNLGTIKGAFAAGLAEEVGSLEVGKKADIVIFDGRTPSMISVSEHDPISAIVFHSSVRDIQTVIIDGVVRKDGFSLTKTPIAKDLDIKEGSVAEEGSLAWEAIAVELDRSRKRMKEKSETVDQDVARDGLIRAFLENFQ
ncbi:hypothetical protein V500_11551 [Pseudogymnoascus sp. VKM F-4518 (FW-2643)]|nr:hypothetical protein V500_11551 [Pseudogymnoascus sp. VKM F-4518 (FW-2643)]